MKQNYLNAAYTQLILEKDYQPVYLDNGTPLNEPEFKVVMRSLPKEEKVVELIDGDYFGLDAINDRLGATPDLSELGSAGKALHYLMVFVFSSGPSPEKAEAIQAAAVRALPYDRIVLTVNLADREVAVRGADKIRAFLAARPFKRLLDADLSEYQSVPDINRLMTLRRQDYSLQFKAGKPVVTYILIGLNVAVFLAMRVLAFQQGVGYEATLDIGAKINNLIIQGQYWRLFTPMFFHVNEIHLLVNCYSLYVLGNVMERIYGHGKFVAIYLVAGIMGNIISFAFSIADAVGASGAIFGLFGALLYFGVEQPKQFSKYFKSSVITTIILNGALWISFSGLDNYAHLGGLGGGFLTAGVCGLKADQAFRTRRWGAVLIIVMIALGGLLIGFTKKY